MPPRENATFSLVLSTTLTSGHKVRKYYVIVDISHEATSGVLPFYTYAKMMEWGEPDSTIHGV
jgi:negative regulator of genetic competence, sporulation and motility